MQGPIREAFIRENFETIFSKLRSYRLDSYIKKLESSKGRNVGKIFPFARGLRFSALLIYSIRKAMGNCGLTASWGQIIDDEGNYLSNECDIIIHKDMDEERWNGDGSGKHIMDFRFINQADVKVVISCKSYITTGGVEVEYFQNLQRFVPRIWLFAECCKPKTVPRVAAKAIKTGYENFWHLYTWDKDTDTAIDNFDGWKLFINALRDLRSEV